LPVSVGARRFHFDDFSIPMLQPILNEKWLDAQRLDNRDSLHDGILQNGKEAASKLEAYLAGRNGDNGTSTEERGRVEKVQ